MRTPFQPTQASRGIYAATLLCLLTPCGFAGSHVQAHLLTRAGASLLHSQPHPDPHPGYLGVSLLEIDKEQVARLHLKDAHGALILSVDRDAPAAAAGLLAHDVIIELNGDRVDSLEQLRRKLRSISAGSTITLRINREGAEQMVSVRLGDEAEIAQRAWEQHFSSQETASQESGSAGTQPAGAPVNGAEASEISGGRPGPESTFTPPTGHVGGSSFLGAFSINAVYTGAQIDPLSTQLAEYFGVHDGAGLLVRDVTENSPAAVAGLKAGDVILRVNNQPVVSRVDWMKQLRANRGHTVQLAVMRNRREQTLTMMAAGGRKG